MEEVATRGAQWTVLVRSNGDALAARAGGPGLELGFLGTPPDLTAPEIEAWLAELIGVAGTTGDDSRGLRDPATSLPIPRTLHQALTGLLFYEAEIWGGAAERSPCAVACLGAGACVAFGWLGPGRVEVLLDGQPHEPEWVLVRDRDGGLARAFVADARLEVEARVCWPATSGGPASAGGEIKARWPGHRIEAPEVVSGPEPARVAARVDEALVEARTKTPVSGSDAPEPRSTQRRGTWHFRSWMDRLAGPRTSEDASSDSARSEPLAHDVPGVPDLLPEPVSEGAEVAAAVEAMSEPEAEVTPEVVEAMSEPDAEVTPEAVEAMSEPEAEVTPEAVEAMSELEAEVTPEAVEAMSEPEAEVTPEAVEAMSEPEVEVTPGPVEATPEPEVELAPEVVEARSEAGIEAVPARCESPVDPFDLVPGSAFEPVPEVAEPVARLESVQAPDPVTLGPAVVDEPTLPPDPAADGSVAGRELRPDARLEGVAHGVSQSRSARIPQRPLVRRPAWPEPMESVMSDQRPLWQKRWAMVAVVVALFAAGWFLGQADFSRGARDIRSALKALGVGAARYEVAITSRPSGAWIAVDGVDQAQRTPVTLELKPGTHQIVLSFSRVGGSSHTVTGRRGQRVALDVDLWGSLKVTVPGGSAPISVAVDGMQRGYAPLDVEQLQPGLHRLQFSGPGVAPWEQTVEVHVNRTAELVAQPVASPATGVLEVRATLADETGSEPLNGAQVWIDGQLFGVTPLKLELPRGPHSIRVRHREEEGPVQVIDLPGGNLRYATVQLGMNLDVPRIVAALPERIPVGRPTVLSASLDGAREGDVREMWLHVRTPEGAWRRYAMTLMKAPGGLVGVAVFPTALFDARGRAAWYVSASTPMGDEYFTEMRPAQVAAKP